MNGIRFALFLGAATFGWAAVDAAPVEFNFRSPRWYPTAARSMTFTQGGITATVTGYRNGSPRAVVRGRPGLGVWSGGWDNPAVDGDRNSNESLRFDFNPSPVAIESVTFRLTGDYFRADNFALSIDGEIVLANEIAPRGDGTFDLSFALGEKNQGSSFEFFTVDRSDDWAIAGMSVSLVGGGGGVAIPEPTSLLLFGFGAGFAGLASRRRRRKKIA